MLKREKDMPANVREAIAKDLEAMEEEGYPV